MTSKFTIRRTAVALLTPLLALGAALATNQAMAKDEADAKANTNECVFSRTVHDWRALDSTNLVIWAPNRKEAYLVKLGFPLHDLKTEESLAVIDRNGDGRLCGFGMDEIVAGRGPFRERSTILGMERLDEASLAALSEQYKVKLLPPQKDAPSK